MGKKDWDVMWKGCGVVDVSQWLLKVSDRDLSSALARG